MLNSCWTVLCFLNLFLTFYQTQYYHLLTLHLYTTHHTISTTFSFFLTLILLLQFWCSANKILKYNIIYLLCDGKTHCGF